MSCSVFVPIPNIVVKSHQTLVAIRPYLPLTSSSDPSDQQEQEEDQQLTAPDSPSSEPSSSSSLVFPSRPSEANLSLRSRGGSGGIATNHSHHHCSSNSNASNSGSQQSSNRISPDSFIPAATCIKISLQPTPTFKFVKPKCPHLHQKHRNQRHFRQQQQQQQESQQQQQQQASLHPRSHSRPHSHCHHRSNSHSSHSPLRRSSSNNTMASSEYRLLSSPETITVKFSYPIPSNSTSNSASIPGVVQVTGNFNAWQRTEPLRKNEETLRFEGEVSIILASIQEEDSSARKKILFKFVLDGSNWVTDPDQELERDNAGNLNNILFLKPRSSRNSGGVGPTSENHHDKGSDEATVVAGPTSTKKNESDEERLAKIKQEEEDDATIREFGGSMWGAPFFDVNNPTHLPEHFVSTSENPTNVEHASAAEEPAFHAASITDTVAVDTHVMTQKSAPEQHEEVKASQNANDEDEDDKIIKELGCGMWGTPHFQVNDSAALPEHFIEALAASNPNAKVKARAAGAEAESEVPNNEATAPVEESQDSELRESVTQIIDIIKNTERATETKLAAESKVGSVNLHQLSIATAGDASPVVDESVDPVPSLTTSRTNSAAFDSEPSSLNNSKVSLHDVGLGFEDDKGNKDDKEDGESDVVLLQTHPIPSQAAHDQVLLLAGDTKPKADLSAATLTISVPEKIPAPAGSTKTKRFSATPVSSPTSSVASSSLNPASRSSSSTTVSQKTEKSERRKSSIWKK
ncbi:hypothetical protein BGZ65_004692, partial [Modicella reniformis]